MIDCKEEENGPELFLFLSSREFFSRKSEQKESFFPVALTKSDDKSLEV